MGDWWCYVHWCPASNPLCLSIHRNRPLPPRFVTNNQQIRWIQDIYIYIHNHNIKYLPQRKLPFSMINCTLRSKLSKLYLVRWFSHTCSCVHIYRLLFDIFYHKTQAILVDFPASHRRVWRFPGPTRARFLLHELGDEACCDLNSWGLVEQDMRIQGGICTNHKTRWYKINDV